MPISCDPSSLAAASTCYSDCISDGMKPAVVIFLLNSISGLNYTPQQLVTAAACFDCGNIPTGLQPAVMNYLLCAIAQKVGA
jgi:hypothetical protein